MMAAFLDIKKANNWLDRRMLNNIFKEKGMCGKIDDWIRDF